MESGIDQLCDWNCLSEVLICDQAELKSLLRLADYDLGWIHCVSSFIKYYE